MKICVCGWYYYDSIYQDLVLVNEAYPVFVVAHRDDMWLRKSGFNFFLRENRGLEWGAYDWYLKNAWDGESNVLYMHDDVRMRPVLKGFSTISPIKIFDAIAELEMDQAYIFKTERERLENYGIHGRAVFASARFNKQLLQDGGFWYDHDNTGHTNGPTPSYCKHFNEADYRFFHYLKGLNSGLLVDRPVILQSFDCARRGKFEDDPTAI